MDRTPSSVDTSPGRATIEPDSPVAPSATAASAAALTSTATTAAPSSASRRAVDRPIPDAPPVTSTCFPLNRSRTMAAL